MTFSPQSLEFVQAKNAILKISTYIIWLSLVHGSITSLFSIFNTGVSRINWPGHTT